MRVVRRLCVVCLFPVKLGKDSVASHRRWIICLLRRDVCDTRQHLRHWIDRHCVATAKHKTTSILCKIQLLTVSLDRRLSYAPPAHATVLSFSTENECCFDGLHPAIFKTEHLPSARTCAGRTLVTYFGIPWVPLSSFLFQKKVLRSRGETEESGCGEGGGVCCVHMTLVICYIL